MENGSNSRRDGILKTVIGGLIVLIVAIWAVFLGPGQLRAAIVYLTGDSSICSFREAWNSVDATQAQWDRFDELQAQSHMVERAADGTERWITPEGDFWVPSGSADDVLYDLAEQDRDIYWTKTGIRPGDVVLDCGANVGLFARTALTRGAARVIAIEPAAENLIALRKNLADEIADGRVTVYEKGVWSQDDVLMFYSYSDNSAADSFVRQGENAIKSELAVTTIDHIVEELGLDRVDFIKMDIEGSERQAIAGAAEVLRRFRPAMALCLYHLADDPVAIPAAVREVEAAYSLECGCVHQNTRIVAEVGHFRAL